MADQSSRTAILLAIAGNGFITVIKGIAWGLSGSGALLAETVHSLVDTVNQALLLVGYRRSLLAPTDRFPYGFGLEAYFWGLLAAIGILVFGGGLTIVHGIEGVAHPELPDRMGWAFLVLIVSATIEIVVLCSVIRGLAATRRDLTWWRHLRRQSPGTITVLLEDAAAVLGCLIAIAALGLCRLTGSGIWDALAQLAIGGMLAGVGLYLVWRNRRALIGESVDVALNRELKDFLEGLDGIDQVTRLKSRQLTAQTFRFKADVVFSGGEIAGPVIPEHQDRVLAADSAGGAREALGRFAHDLMIAQARHVDRLETTIRRRFPGAIYIDLEPHIHEA